MRYAIIFVALVLVAGCVSGPVPETYELQRLNGDSSKKLAEIAIRQTLARYSSAMARTWRIWKAHEARVKGHKPSGDLTPDQAQRWANEQGDTLVEGAEARDDSLASLDSRRAVELQDINKLHANQMATLASIVKGWAIQGKISTQQMAGWMEVAQFGVATYIENRNAKRLRKEAEEAARREAEAEEG